MSYSDEVLADSPFAYLRMDSAGTVFSSVVNTYSLNRQGPTERYEHQVPGLVNDDVNTAFEFKNHVVLGTPSVGCLITSGTQQTQWGSAPNIRAIEFLVKLTQTPQEGGFYEVLYILRRIVGSTLSNERIVIYYNITSGLIQIARWAPGGSGEEAILQGGLSLSGRRLHLVIRYDSIEDVTQLVINGVVVDSKDGLQFNDDFRNYMVVGAAGPADFGSSSVIDEFAFYATAPSIERIRVHAQEALGDNWYALSRMERGRSVATMSRTDWRYWATEVDTVENAEMVCTRVNTPTGVSDIAPFRTLFCVGIIDGQALITMFDRYGKFFWAFKYGSDIVPIDIIEISSSPEEDLYIAGNCIIGGFSHMYIAKIPKSTEYTTVEWEHALGNTNENWVLKSCYKSVAAASNVYICGYANNGTKDEGIVFGFSPSGNVVNPFRVWNTENYKFYSVASSGLAGSGSEERVRASGWYQNKVSDHLIFRKTTAIFEFPQSALDFYGVDGYTLFEPNDQAGRRLNAPSGNQTIQYNTPLQAEPVGGGDKIGVLIRTTSIPWVVKVSCASGEVIPSGSDIVSTDTGWTACFNVMLTTGEDFFIFTRGRESLTSFPETLLSWKIRKEGYDVVSNHCEVPYSGYQSYVGGYTDNGVDPKQAFIMSLPGFPDSGTTYPANDFSNYFFCDFNGTSDTNPATVEFDTSRITENISGFTYTASPTYQLKKPGASITLSPSSDVSAGGWTTEPLFSKVNEGSENDSPLISSQDNSNSTATLGFTVPSEALITGANTGQLTVRYKKSATGGHTIGLGAGVVGDTSWGSQTFNGIGIDFVTSTFNISVAQATPTIIRVNLSRTGDTGGSPGNRRSTQVSWAQLQVTAAVYQYVPFDIVWARCGLTNGEIGFDPLSMEVLTELSTAFISYHVESTPSSLTLNTQIAAAGLFTQLTFSVDGLNIQTEIDNPVWVISTTTLFPVDIASATEIETITWTAQYTIIASAIASQTEIDSILSNLQFSVNPTSVDIATFIGTILATIETFISPKNLQVLTQLQPVTWSAQLVISPEIIQSLTELGEVVINLQTILTSSDLNIATQIDPIAFVNVFVLRPTNINIDTEIQPVVLNLLHIFDPTTLTIRTEIQSVIALLIDSAVQPDRITIHTEIADIEFITLAAQPSVYNTYTVPSEDRSHVVSAMPAKIAAEAGPRKGSSPLHPDDFRFNAEVNSTYDAEKQ